MAIEPSHFLAVHYENVYPGIDLTYYGNQRQLEYDFVVSPGASPQRIRMAFAGAKSIRVDSVGDLILNTNAGDVKVSRPIAYQTIKDERREVAASFILRGRQVSFKVGAYNQNEPLVIDPVLIYSSIMTF